MNRLCKKIYNCLVHINHFYGSGTALDTKNLPAYKSIKMIDFIIVERRAIVRHTSNTWSTQYMMISPEE